MRKLLGTLALLPLGLTARAQAPAQKTAAVVILQAPSSVGCPVGFQARRAQQGAVINVSPSSKFPGQGYSITFSSLKDPGILQAKITLHGISGHHVMPAVDASYRGAEASESFNVSPSAGSQHLFHSTIYTEKLTGVQWVELNELTYADGTKWQESTTATCRVAPNGYMLVANTR